MYKSLQATFPRDHDYPQRTHRIAMMTAVVQGKIYDNLGYGFDQEKTLSGEYIPLRTRRPSVRSGLIRTVVDDSVSLLFSEGHFPEIDCEDEPTRESIDALVKEISLNATMIESATIGSVGSVCIWLRVLSGRVFINPLSTVFLTPEWDNNAPDTLIKVTELRKVAGTQLKPLGYDVDGKDTYWYRREWDGMAETWFMPQEVGEDDKPPVIDTQRTITHSLGFVPMVWVKNLPGGDDIDGAPTASDDAINTVIEIDYQLSQAGRGLKYSSDPTLLLKEPAIGNNGEIIKGGGNAIVVNSDGDGKLLEINGTAANAVIDYVKFLRETALESLHGNRTSAEKMSAAQSGRAMEMMMQSLIWLADKLRISYGEGALLELLNMIVAASQKYPLHLKSGVKLTFAKAPISLRWPDWFAPTASDRAQTANCLKTHIDSGTMSRETAVKSIAADYDIEDIKAELALIANEQAERQAQAIKQVTIAE
jgi:hypothetical protein